MNNEIITGYSSALFDIALENKQLDKFKNEIILIQNALEENRDFVALANNYALTKDDKIELIKSSFKDFNSNLINLLCILAIKHRFNYVIKIFKNTIKQINSSLNVKQCLIYSNPLLTKTDIDKLTQKYSKELGVELESKNILDESLIAGVKIVIDDKVFENSIKSRIEQLKEELLKGAA